MPNDPLLSKCADFLHTLCVDIPGRNVGSEGNRRATRFFRDTVAAFGWQTESTELDVMNWSSDGALLQAGGRTFPARSSPYSRGCSVRAPLVFASSLAELDPLDAGGKILVLHGEIAQEQLMPKNFVFYNPDEHRQIIARLEQQQPAAIVSITGRNAALAGGLYPFPLFEDGDFDIPSVFLSEEEGNGLLSLARQTAALESRAVRIPSKAFNVVVRKGNPDAPRIVLTAHIDAKLGTPGAIDNATGVAVLLLLAERLRDYAGPYALEMAAFNGEDYYAVPGQMDYLRQNQGRFGSIALNINIDGAGYRNGPSAFSFFDIPEPMQAAARRMLDTFADTAEGPLWPQGDHSIFVQQGCPALAVSSLWLLQHMDSQDITHTPKDNLDIVDPRKVAAIAEALDWFLHALTHGST
ncbi:MAG: M28 family peptidase [Kiritimatiellae bacterium]|jgi:aminopeptidase YwaD|nr:M28 family peptidase [Kiritimatiellia bacterium]